MQALVVLYSVQFSHQALALDSIAHCPVAGDAILQHHNHFVLVHCLLSL